MSRSGVWSRAHLSTDHARAGCYVLSVSLLCWFLAAGIAFSKTVEGVFLPNRLHVQSHVLALAACGVRATLWLEHYVTAVYVPRGASLQALSDPRRPKAIAVHVIEADYFPDDIPSKWRLALERALARTAMAQLRHAYRSLRAGDVMTIVYTPSHGVVLDLNGEPLVRAAGHAVIDSVLKAWAQDSLVRTKLKRLERGHSC